MGSTAQPGSGDELLPTRSTLLARLRNHRDSKAWHQGWEEFYELYHPVIFRYACKRGLREEDAEDVVQEIVIGVARNIPQFRYDPRSCTFKTWLFRVARNKIVNHLRKRGRQERGPVVSGGGDDDALEQVADAAALSPDQEWDLAWESNLRRAALDQVGRRVKPMTMRLFLHHVMDGHNVEETVAHFRESGVTAEAVHLAKHRVQKMLDETVARLRATKLES